MQTSYAFKIMATLAVVLFCTLPMVDIKAQNVTIANSTGANGTYATLKAAFDALNAQSTQAGNNITVFYHRQHHRNCICGA